MSNSNFKWDLISVIPRLPCNFWIGNAVSSTVDLVNRHTGCFVNTFYIAMYTFASKCFYIELVPCSDEP